MPLALVPNFGIIFKEATALYQQTARDWDAKHGSTASAASQPASSSSAAPPAAAAAAAAAAEGAGRVFTHAAQVERLHLTGLMPSTQDAQQAVADGLAAAERSSQLALDLDWEEDPEAAVADLRRFLKQNGRVASVELSAVAGSMGR